jgi:uncharacterized protein DUF6577
LEKEIKSIILKKLGHKQQFTNHELQNILRKWNPQVSNSAHAWWINKLKKDGFISHIGRGIYSLQQKKEYRPELSRIAKQFYNKTLKLLPENTTLLMYENFSVTDILGMERMNHFIFMHVPKEHLEFFFYDILHLGKRVFIKPGKEVTERYITPFSESVILYPLLSDMPFLTIGAYKTLSLEGMLVHSIIFGEEYYRARAVDMKSAFKVAMDNYNVNISKLLRYAARRERKKQIVAILSELGYI